ncbi:Nuclear Rna Export Factor 1 [Manis pentadactyla]|nr:Nuclear Rna Export Factor 1 [Manis pentadactyla]
MGCREDSMRRALQWSRAGRQPEPGGRSALGAPPGAADLLRASPRSAAVGTRPWRGGSGVARAPAVEDGGAEPKSQLAGAPRLRVRRWVPGRRAAGELQAGGGWASRDRAWVPGARAPGRRGQDAQEPCGGRPLTPLPPEANSQFLSFCSERRRVSLFIM